jgi:hypothetical protein
MKEIASCRTERTVETGLRFIDQLSALLTRNLHSVLWSVGFDTDLALVPRNQKTNLSALHRTVFTAAASVKLLTALLADMINPFHAPRIAYCNIAVNLIAVERMERELSQPCLPTMEPEKVKQEVML